MSLSCCFASDEEDCKIHPDAYYPATHDYPRYVAQEFAAYAQHEMDMWDFGNDWDGDYAIVVIDPDTRERKVFDILREYEPTLSATEVKEETK